MSKRNTTTRKTRKNTKLSLEQVADGELMKQMDITNKMMQPIGIEDPLPDAIAKQIKDDKIPYAPGKKIVMRRRRKIKPEGPDMLSKIAKYGAGALALGGGIYALDKLFGDTSLGKGIKDNLGPIVDTIDKAKDTIGELLNGNTSIFNYTSPNLWQDIYYSSNMANTALLNKDTPLIERIAAYGFQFNNLTADSNLARETLIKLKICFQTENIKLINLIHKINLKKILKPQRET